MASRISFWRANMCIFGFSFTAILNDVVRTRSR